MAGLPRNAAQLLLNMNMDCNNKTKYSKNDIVGKTQKAKEM